HTHTPRVSLLRYRPAPPPVPTRRSSDLHHLVELRHTTSGQKSRDTVTEHGRQERHRRHYQPATHHQPRAGGDQPEADHDPPVGVDRKSTRLNSSHVSISYAVFCLKKKT